MPHVLRWISWGGYPLLFGMLFSCGLGVPIPEDIPLVVSGILVARHRMFFALAAPLAWMGIIGGDCMLYMFGRKYGEKIVDLPFIGHHVTLDRLRKVEKMFVKYGIAVVFVGRLFMGIRGAVVVTAGASRYKFWKFIVTDGLAAIVSGGLFFWLGYWGGSHLDRDVRNQVIALRHYIWLGAGVLALGLAIFFLIYFWRDRSREQAPSPVATDDSRPGD